MKEFALIIVWLLISISIPAQKKITVLSPNGSIQISMQLKDRVPSYNVSFKKKPVIENAELSLSFLETGVFKNNIAIQKTAVREGLEEYELIVGKAKIVRDNFREAIINMEEKTSPFRKVNFVVRVFNDGLAFRYEFPAQDNWKNLTITDENTSFRFVGDPKLLTLFLPNFTSSHEGEYSSLYLSEVIQDTLMDMPTLLEFPNQFYVALTEAALVNYAGMYLVKRNGILRSLLSPLPSQTPAKELGEGVKVKAGVPFKSPWRVMMISDRVGALIESNILTSLNEPCEIKDLSWIKTGKTTWPWWNGNVTPDTTFAPGNNFETNKYYIDFCGRNGLEFHSVVEYGGHEWYASDGENFFPGKNTDATTPVPGLDMKQICDYAASKNVGIRLWVHWAALYPKLDEAFVQYEKWGIKGLMVDFMDRDDQEMVNIQNQILQKAASHKLHIQFHGAYKPTGLSRTYPNEFTREGTLNYESNKWSPMVNPDHDINIPFTRMLAGSTDYHLGGFRAVADSLFKVQYTRPLMLGTRCHMLAMYVVLENYLGMVCDYPEAYEGQPGFEFLKIVPTTWDETKVPDAKPGEYIVVARRKGHDWFVGAITNKFPREISIPLSFLDNGEYSAELYSDGEDVNINPNHLTKQNIATNKREKITLKLAKGGGAVLRITKK